VLPADFPYGHHQACLSCSLQAASFPELDFDFCDAKLNIFNAPENIKYILLTISL
jgi:hypothetical protein